MKALRILSISVLAGLWMSTAVFAAAEPGAQAPYFEVIDSTGKVQKLSDYIGKSDWLVLEWFNKDCPYVKKHYGSKNMQSLQKKYTETKKVKWLTVVSSAKGKQGYLTPKEAQDLIKSNGSSATALLLDTDGKMGNAYGAVTTPHMFVISPKGVVVYAGAIDSDDSSDPKVIATSTNYVAAALDSSLQTPSKTVAKAYVKPYGCGVKYQ